MELIAVLVFGGPLIRLREWLHRIKTVDQSGS
jgi:hypothetical protein